MTSGLSAQALALRAARMLEAEQAAEAGAASATPVGAKPASALTGGVGATLAHRFDPGSAIAGAAAGALAALMFWRQQ
jgi:hypothetical protein